jgi:hypothetical protein
LVCPHCLTNKDEENVVIKNACNIFVLLSLAGTKLCQRMDSRPRIFSKIFLRLPGPPQTRYTPSFLIFKKKLKFDGG